MTPFTLFLTPLLVAVLTSQPGCRYDRDAPEPTAPLPAPQDLAGTWALTWMTPSGPRTATLRLDLEFEGTLTVGEDRFPLGELMVEGRAFAFTVLGFPGRLDYEGSREGATLRGTLSVDGYRVGDFQGTKIDDGPSEYFDDARSARRR